jgi:hypothetical protein
MIDRALGVIGIALTLLSGALQYFFSDLPKWVLPVGYGAGVLLVGVSLGLLTAGGLRTKRPVRQRAFLRLHIFGDHRAPNRLDQENIFRWYYLQMVVNGIGPQGQQRVATWATLFLTFEDDVTINTIHVRSPDMQLPVYEVKEFNQRYAIILFSDNVPAGTLEVEVSP